MFVNNRNIHLRDYRNYITGECKFPGFIYKNKLTNLDTTPGGKTVCIGFNEDEQAWYGWTHRGFGKFDIGYEIKEDSIMSNINSKYPRIKYPFKCETLEDCKECAMKISDELD